ncbi:MAG: GGDEF domain-containing protein [Desulfohalobiaceae bacterium]|nr:GGDEF domain-containing protein [Desulfohalobiaceae bacterium]
MSEKSIFSRETKVIDEAESLAARAEFSGNSLLQPYLDLLKEYRKLFRQTQRVVKMSDRMQQSLNELNADLHDHKEILSKMSYVDGLTAIANRRRFNECIETEWNRDQRTKNPLALMILDLDHFKQFNDNYGHGAGDDCLIKCAQVMVQSIKRPADLAARYGGEEFAILLPETELSGAMQVASDVQAGISDLAIKHEYSPTSSIVTVSIGVAVMVPSPHSTYQELIEAADAQLYAAKNAGRNQIKGMVGSNGQSNSEVL